MPPMPPETPLPAALPIPAADPKPWSRSSTIVASLAQVGIGLVLILAAAVGWLPADATALGAAQIGLGLAAVRGRARAEQPIAPMPVVQLAVGWLSARLAGRG